MASAFSPSELFSMISSAGGDLIRIYFDGKDSTRWVRAVSNVTTTAFRERNINSYLNSINFSNLLRKNISSQRHMQGYAPLNDRYAMWKATYGKYTSGHWQLFGSLLGSISPTKLGDNKWLGGVRPGAKDSGRTSWFGKRDKGRSMDISQYGRWGEFGRSKQPARPIVAPTTDEYANEGWLKEGKSGLRKIGNKWR